MYLPSNLHNRHFVGIFQGHITVIITTTIITSIIIIVITSIITINKIIITIILQGHTGALMVAVMILMLWLYSAYRSLHLILVKILQKY